MDTTIAIIVLAVIALVEALVIAYMVKVVAAAKVSKDGYEFRAALTTGKPKNDKPKRRCWSTNRTES